MATAAVVGWLAAGCQLDPGNFGAFQFYDPERRQIATVHVDEDRGGVTTEHWAFNSQAYDPARGVDTVRSGDPGNFDRFRTNACRSPPRKYLMVATTENPLDCGQPTQPNVKPPTDSVLGDGSYEVRQRGNEVGTVFVQNRIEHWAVITDRFRRADGFQVRPRSTALDWASFAQYACKAYAQRTYWVVTATAGSLCG
jgi:hypothetical protein